MMWHSVIYLYLLSQIHLSLAEAVTNKNEQHSVDMFREYLRIDTSNPDNIDYAIDFLIRYVDELGIPYEVYKPADKPILVATIQGSDPSLPSIMLNSHIDVVATESSEWKYPPFEAYMDANGDIYARGSQDTKDVGIQYLEAIRKLKHDNITLLRTVHVTFMPDEETGGLKGMYEFVKTKEFKSLNIGFALDEGGTSPDNELYAIYAGRRSWQLKFVIHGVGGHGSSMPDDTAMDKVGETGNVIPSKLTLVIDLRLSENTSAAEMESIIQSWIDVTGNSTELTYLLKETEAIPTSVDDCNPYWITMKTTLNDMDIEIKPIRARGALDTQKLRNIGIPALGFSTKRNTVTRLHGKDEYQNVETFLNGIEIYKELIKNLANIPLCYENDNSSQ